MNASKILYTCGGGTHTKYSTQKFIMNEIKEPENMEMSALSIPRLNIVKVLNSEKMTSSLIRVFYPLAQVDSFS